MSSQSLPDLSERPLLPTDSLSRIRNMVWTCNGRLLQFTRMSVTRTCNLAQTWSRTGATRVSSKMSEAQSDRFERVGSVFFSLLSREVTQFAQRPQAASRICVQPSVRKVPVRDLVPSATNRACNVPARLGGLIRVCLRVVGLATRALGCIWPMASPTIAPTSGARRSP